AAAIRFVAALTNGSGYYGRAIGNSDYRAASDLVPRRAAAPTCGVVPNRALGFAVPVVVPGVALRPGAFDPGSGVHSVDAALQRDAVGPAPGAVVLIGGAPRRGFVPVSGARPGVADPRLAAADSLPHRAGARSEIVEAETDPDYHAAGRDGLGRLPSHGPRAP